MPTATQSYVKFNINPCYSATTKILTKRHEDL